MRTLCLLALTTPWPMSKVTPGRGDSPSLTACPLTQAVLLPLLRVTNPDTEIKVGMSAWSLGAFRLTTRALRSWALNNSVPNDAGVCAPQFAPTKNMGTSRLRHQNNPEALQIFVAISILDGVWALAITVLAQRLPASMVD
jgi:hypothetical protein